MAAVTRRSILAGAALASLGSGARAQGEAIGDPAAFHICGAEFHAGIHRAAGDRLLAAFLQEVYAEAQQLRRPALEDPAAARRSWQDHRRILAALEARDPEAAAAAMAAHLARIHSRRPPRRRSKG